MGDLIANAHNDFQQIFGTPKISIYNPPDAPAAFGGFIAFAIRFFLIIAAFSMLVYLLWGAFEYISSQGEKDNIDKARRKMVNAVIGLLIVFAVLTIYSYVAGDILGIIERTDEGWRFILPRIGE